MNILGVIGGSIVAVVFGVIIAILLLLIALALLLASTRDKRYHQNIKDLAFLNDYFYKYYDDYENFNKEAKEQYKTLPNYSSRRDYLQTNHPRFWRALERALYYKNSQKENLPPTAISQEQRYVAKYIDFRVLLWQADGDTLTFDEAFELYSNNSNLPLLDLQYHIDDEQYQLDDKQEGNQKQEEQRPLLMEEEE